MTSTSTDIVTPAATEAPATNPTPEAAPKAPRSTSRAATAGRNAVAKRQATKAAPKAKASKPKAAKVATPAAAKRPVGPAPKTHPFAAGGCLVMLGDPAKPTAVKVAFLSTSIMLDDSIAEAVKAGAVTADQVKAGHVFACQTRNVWQRLSR